MRGDKGEFWWELRPCDYYADFSRPKIMYPDIAKTNRFYRDEGRLYSTNTTYFIPTGDWFLLGILNSKTTWFSISGISIPFGERAGEFRYRLFSQYIERLPIPDADDGERQRVGNLARKCAGIAPQIHQLKTAFARRLHETFATAASQKVNEATQEWPDLTFAAVGVGIKTSFRLAANPFKNPRTADEWEPYFLEKKAEVDVLSRQLADAEAELNDRVYRLFNLTPEEVKLLQREIEH